MTIQEILLKNNIITETAAAEFYKLDNKYYAILNGKTTSLDEFINLTSRDNSYADVADAIKAKMKSMNYSGDIKEFIKKYFKFKNEKLDVFVKNGNNNNIYDKTSIIKRSSYDEKEIETELEKDKKLSEGIITEKYSERAETVANEIINRYRNSPKRKKILIGDLLGIDIGRAYLNVSSSGTTDAADTSIDSSKGAKHKFVINIKPVRSEEKFKSLLVHEIVHILNYKKSKGKTFDYTSKYASPRFRYYERNQIPSKIKNFVNKSDKNWSDYNLDYIRNADELDAFYNQFIVFLKGKKYKSSLEIRKALYGKSNTIDKTQIDYYLKENKAIKKYFMKRFYLDGLIKSVEDNI